MEIFREWKRRRKIESVGVGKENRKGESVKKEEVGRKR